MSASPADVWAECLSALDGKANAGEVDEWLRPLVCQRFDGAEIVLQAADHAAAQQVESRYRRPLQQAVRQVSGLRPSLKIIVRSNSSTVREPAKPVDVGVTQEIAPAETSERLNQNYTFDNLVIGEGNRWAALAAHAVSECPGNSGANPLLLHGPAGLGKTHIMQAVAHRCSVGPNTRRTRYVTSEGLMRDFVNAIKSKRMNQFVDRYRQAEILLVEDIQFLSGKQKLQEEFFHTFNALHQEGNQIVLSADRSPSQVDGIDERLTSRFQWGIVAEICRPDLETRAAILQQKALQRGVGLPDDVTGYLAARISGNIRELEGALNFLFLLCDHLGEQASISLAEKALNQNLKLPAPRGHLTIDCIQEAVSTDFEVPKKELLGGSRKRDVTVARQAAMYLCKKLTPYSLSRIAGHFHRRDHTTVRHACRRTGERMENDTQFARRISALSMAVGGRALI